MKYDKRRTVPLSQVCTLNMGQSPSFDSYNENKDGLPFFQGNADFGNIYPKERVWCSQPTKIANKDDILLSVRAPIGALNIAKEECCIGRGLAALSPIPSQCRMMYLFYALKSKVKILEQQGTGSTFKAVGKDIISALHIPLYPLEEQEHIISMLSCTDKGIANIHKQLAKLDTLVKSRFIELYNSTVLSQEATIDEIVKSIKVGFVGKCEQYYTDANGIPMLRTGNITSKGLDLSNLKYVTKEFHEKNKKSQIHTGDILIARHGTNGQANVYHGSEAQCLNAVVIVPDVNKVTSVFLAGLINSCFVRNQIERTLVGSTQRVINTKSIAKLVVRIPSLSVQKRYEDFVEQTEKSKLVLRRLLEKQELLRAALMQEYFG